MAKRRRPSDAVKFRDQPKLEDSYIQEESVDARLAHALDALVSHFTENWADEPAELSIADLTRVVQLRRELSAEAPLSMIEVRWVESELETGSE